MIVNLAPDRIRVTYRFALAPAAAEAAARALALEQTVELPDDLVPDGPIRDTVVGRVEALSAAGDGASDAVVSYATTSVGSELTQLLNLIFGNSSLIPGVRMVGLELPTALLDSFSGPRFGRAGLRAHLGVAERPLLCTALKPLGLGTDELAELAYRCALGGVDIIKDDHGLADQPYAPFAERVARCAEAVMRANHETGEGCVYVANITAPAHLVVERARTARAAGAGGLMLAPGLTGLDVLRQLAADELVALPILSHPAFQGSFVTSPTGGITPGLLFGTLARLAGADATIFPNDGGRFTFSRSDCDAIAAATAAPLGQLAPIFPVPAGGVSLERVPELLDRYGREVILLLGASLLRAGPDIPRAARALRAQLEARVA
jgi:ribulose-bisphosphate carboxylase large chain